MINLPTRQSNVSIQDKMIRVCFLFKLVYRISLGIWCSPVICVRGDNSYECDLHLNREKTKTLVEYVMLGLK